MQEKDDNLNLFVLAGMMALLGVILTIALVSGCGAGKVSCAVVDVAKQVCDYTPVRYLTPEGQEVIEQVPTDDLKALAERHRLTRMGQQPPATDAGSKD